MASFVFRRAMATVLTVSHQAAPPPADPITVVCRSAVDRHMLGTAWAAHSASLGLTYVLREAVGSGADPGHTFDWATYHSQLRSTRLGHTVLHARSVSSTQSVVRTLAPLAAAAADAASTDAIQVDPLPLVCVADQQTAGTGRGSNTWVSPAGCLMFTFTARTRRVAQLAFVQYLVSLALVDAICGAGAPGSGGDGGGGGGELGAFLRPRIRIKWPNDIYTADGRKLGGVLCQSHMMGATVDLTCVCKSRLFFLFLCGIWRVVFPLLHHPHSFIQLSYFFLPYPSPPFESLVAPSLRCPCLRWDPGLFLCCCCCLDAGGSRRTKSGENKILSYFNCRSVPKLFLQSSLLLRSCA